MLKKQYQRLLFRFKHLSIRNRFFSAACLWFGGVILVAGLVIPELVDDYLNEEVSAQLQLSMDELVDNVTVDETGVLMLRESLSEPRFKQAYSGLYWSVSGGSYALRSASLADKNIAAGDEGNDDFLVGARGEKLIHIDKTISIAGLPAPLMLTIGIDENPLEEALHLLIGKLWIILQLLFFGVLGFLWLLVQWSLRPLDNLQEDLQALRSGQSNSIEGNYPSEIEPLIGNLNALIFHYQELLQRARNHAGNLSHSIKTPLSVLNNQVGELSEKDQAPLLASIQQLQTQIDYHMSRARMAGSMNILSVKSKPSKRVDAISMAFDKVYGDRQVTLVNELEEELELPVEQADLDEMLGNLIENGYKWASSLIRVHAQIDAKRLYIIIEDDGDGIAEAQLSNIIKRGVRLDESTPGTGLGLNIVSELAHSYRGELSFEKSNLGGVKAILHFNAS